MRRAGAELSKIFASIDVFYVDGAIKLRGVEERSSLGGDDKKTVPFPLSHAVSRHLLVSIDHFHSLRASLQLANALNTYAPFTLLRGSLEGATNALWLLKPEQRNERITRHVLACLAEEPPAEPRGDSMESLIVQYGLDRSRVLGGIPSFGSIAMTEDKEIWCKGDNIGELGWRM
ncbi:hypothetical protein CVV67_01875 [Arthrobacter stackebrandtii]|nr:hypothetical protein CVV67_01875 [Arthrobacter stackebrandtii]